MQVTQSPPARLTATSRPGLLERLTIEHGIWLALGALVAITRLWALGDSPLSNAEAALANEALALARGHAAAPLDPLLGGLMGVLFAVFSPTAASARFVPALASVGVCLVPYLFRARIGRTAALLLGGLLALSPTLWFLGRQADGSLLAWTLALLAWAFAQRNQPRASGAALGALLATGTDAVVPVVVLVLIASLGLWGSAFPLARVLPVGLAAFALGATTLLWNLPGAASALAGIADYFTGFVRNGPMTVGRAMLGLLVYELAIVLGALAELFLSRQAYLKAVTGECTTLALRPGWLVMLFAGLLLAVLRSARSAADIAPVAIAASAMTALLLARVLGALTAQRGWLSAGITAGLSLIFLLVAELGLRQYAGLGDNRWLVLGILALFIICTGAIALTLRLNGTAIGQGVILALAVFFSLGAVGKSIALTVTHPANPAEPWVTDAITRQAAALQRTVEELATRAYGDPATLPIEISEKAPPAIRWALRGQMYAAYVSQPQAPAAALLPGDAAFANAKGYLANGVPVLERNSLNSVRCTQVGDKMDCQPLARWIVLREASEDVPTQWTLYVRSDIATRAAGQGWK
ncbi:MAG: hypothetical protein K1X39_01145 [Thermoflexales bacterium]|nr:hypothetical protein [Thermoflexales bacterium]